MALVSSRPKGRVARSESRTELPPALFGILGRHLDLNCVVDNEVHELVEALIAPPIVSKPPRMRETDATTYSDLALDADRELLVQPDRHGRVRLQKLEDEVDGREQDPAASSSSSWSSRHC